VKSIKEKQIETFKTILRKSNTQINLFSRKNFEIQIEKLFKDTMYTMPFFKNIFNSDEEILDVGSGNGFPGMICAIFYPKSRFILCERNRKKAEFLKHVAFQIQA